MGKVEVNDHQREPEREILIRAGGGATLIGLTTTPELAKQGAARLKGGGEVTAADLREAAKKIDEFAKEETTA